MGKKEFGFGRAGRHYQIVKNHKYDSHVKILGSKKYILLGMKYQV